MGSGLFAEPGLKRANALIRPLEGFVLHQRGLHQRIGRVGGAPEPLHDGPFGIGIALRALERGETIEQFGNERAFLRSHGSWPPLTMRLM